MEIAQAKGAKKVVELQVSGAFHSSLMEEASLKLKQVVKNMKISKPKIPVLSIISAQYQTEPEKIRENLIYQLRHTTKWEESVRFMSAQGIKVFFEIGSGKVLKGLIKRIDPELLVHNIEKEEDFLNPDFAAGHV